MKVLLVNPPLDSSTTRRLGPVAAALFYNSMPLGICYLAAVLRKERNIVKIIDAPVERLSIDDIVKKVIKFNPDAVGITSFTVSANSCYELAKQIKKNKVAAKVIIGGPHINANIEDLKYHPEFDIAVLGEGELTFKELLVKISEDISKVEGVAYLENGEIIVTPKRSYIKDLDILPYPARDLLPVHKYRPQPNDQRRLPKLSMVSSRGCPYNCIFCDKNVFGSIYRSFSPEYIAGEMKHLVKDFGAKDIAFVDSTFTFTRERTLQVVKKVKEANLGVSWTCSVRADILDKSLLKEMKDSGCWRVRIGVESGSSEVLKFIKKGITRSQIRRAASWAYELDLEPKAFFMLGHLNDTKVTIEQTVDFALELPLKDITVQINTPLKNTPQHELADRFGDWLTDDLSRSSFWEVVFVPKGLSYKELSQYHRKFYLRFYLRPKIWFRHIIKIRSFIDLIKYLRGTVVLAFMCYVWLKRRL